MHSSNARSRSAAAMHLHSGTYWYKIRYMFRMYTADFTLSTGARCMMQLAILHGSNGEWRGRHVCRHAGRAAGQSSYGARSAYTWRSHASCAGWVRFGTTDNLRATSAMECSTVATSTGGVYMGEADQQRLALASGGAHGQPEPAQLRIGARIAVAGYGRGTYVRGTHHRLRRWRCDRR